MVDPKGLPVSGVSVRSGKVRTTTYRDGKYLLQGVDTGRIAIEFSKQSYKSVNRTIAIRRGEFRELNIRDFEGLVETRSTLNVLKLPLSQLTRVGSYLFASPSPDRRLIATEILDKETAGYDIWLLSDKGEKIRPLSQLPDDESNPAWSPRGDAVVYSSYSSRFGYRILLKKVEGHQDFELVDFGVTPSWSPDGASIVFAKSERAGVWEIWTKNLVTKDSRPLTSHGGRTQYPTWGKVGGRDVIVYASSVGTRGETYELWMMNLDGTGQRKLTSGGLNFIGPAISPDGKMIACWSLQRNGPNSVWIMRSDGSDLQKVVDNAANPQWLDASSLLVSAKISGTPQIWKTEIR